MKSTSNPKKCCGNRIKITIIERSLRWENEVSVTREKVNRATKYAAIEWSSWSKNEFYYNRLKFTSVNGKIVA